MKEHRMLSVDEALKIVLESTPALSAVSRPSLEAIDLAVDEDIISREDIPPFTNSALDGYAVRSSDVLSASKNNPVILRIVDRVHAGTISQKKLNAGQAIQIMTGAPVPDGADAVIMVEQTETIGSDQVKLFSSAAVHEGVRWAGEDIRKEQTVFQKGRILKPYDIGVLASIGLSAVRVIPKPKVAILATGDELLGAGEPMTAGKIRSSNSMTLHALIKQFGAEPLDLGIARDTLEATEQKLRAAFSADVIITSGGVSMGERDFVRTVLESLGVEIKFWKVKQRPGKPLVFGIKDKKLFFGLPGNPVSTSVCYELYVVPAMLRMSGQDHRPLRVRARLDHAVTKKPGLRHFLRGIVMKTDQGYSVKTTGNQSSGVMSSMAYANSLIDLPEDKENVPSGEEVDVIVLEPRALF